MKIGLVQINGRFDDQVYLPYSVGLLQAYAISHLPQPARVEFLPIIYSPMDPEEAARKLSDADAVFFSVYVWNKNISSSIATALKQRNRDVAIIFGGPQIPCDAEDFLRRNRFVDVACHGEGEKTFVEALARVENRNWGDVPSVSFLTSEGKFLRTPMCAALEDLSTIPSPYLEGVFDPLMRMQGEKWTALWETSRGCPYSCSFCDWGSALHSRVRQFPMERLVQELGWFAEHKIEFIFCTDANFGLLPRDLDLARIAATVKRKRGYPHVISTQSSKALGERAFQIQKVLAAAQLSKGATLSLQSLNPTALRSVHRANIPVSDFKRFQNRFQREKIKTYTDMILGLPGETYDSFADGIAWLIDNGQHNHIQFNTLSILPNADMAKESYREQHGLVTTESKLVNPHGSFPISGTPETHSIVITTKTLSEEDWVRAMVYRWMVSLVYFDKLFQIPFVVLRSIGGVPYRQLIEIFCEGPLRRYPVLAEIRNSFRRKALEVRAGDSEFSHSAKWLDLWWPTDELAFIQLCAEMGLDRFYREALDLVIESMPTAVPRQLLNESALLNQALIKLPRRFTPTKLSLSFNLWSYFRSKIEGRSLTLKKSNNIVTVDPDGEGWADWAEWCKGAVWFGSKNGDYLYESVTETLSPGGKRVPVSGRRGTDRRTLSPRPRVAR